MSSKRRDEGARGQRTWKAVVRVEAAWLRAQAPSVLSAPWTLPMNLFSTRQVSLTVRTRLPGHRDRMDLDTDRYSSRVMGSKWGSKPRERKTRDPGNRNSSQKEGKGNGKDDHKRKSQNSSDNVQRAREWAPKKWN